MLLGVFVTIATVKQWLEFDNFEVHPCALLGDQGQPVKNYDDVSGTNFEQVEEGDPDIMCWVVYGHYTWGGLDGLFDFSTKAEALEMKEQLRVRLAHIQREEAGRVGLSH